MNQEVMEVEAFGELGIIALESCRDLGEKINAHLLAKRKELNIPTPDTFLIPHEEIRFSNGEGKIKLTDSVRGRDIYLLCDIGNYSCKYELYGYENLKGPDEHFQDIKRTLSAIGGKARRITVIMPMLYASRQHRRKGRESMDCAIALQELERLGVQDIITFDVHDPNIQNAIPLSSFENLFATYEILKTFIADEPDILRNPGDLLVISPDPGAMDRAIYYAGILNVDVGLFYKRRDYSKIIHGKNPIVQHEFMGRDVENKNILIVDDMISSGESVLDIAKELKKRKANKIFASTTFSLFTEGPKKFDKLYEEGLLDGVYTTNLTYVPESFDSCEWFKKVDMSKYLASVVDTLNYNQSMKPLIHASRELTEIIESFRNLK